MISLTNCRSTFFYETRKFCAILNYSTMVQVAFVWYFVENIFSKRCTFWSAWECRHSFPQYICEWRICAVKMVRESMTKILFFRVAAATISLFCDTTFCLSKLTTYEPPYMIVAKQKYCLLHLKNFNYENIQTTIQTSIREAWTFQQPQPKKSEVNEAWRNVMETPCLQQQPDWISTNKHGVVS